MEEYEVLLLFGKLISFPMCLFSRMAYKVTQAVPGLSCADVLRKMQHEPQMECVFDEGAHGLDHDAIEKGIASSFCNTHYLVKSCGILIASDDDNGYYYSDVNNYDTVVDSCCIKHACTLTRLR
ncbi:hypothetical protein AgCh_020443 [Apium graveolens]